MALISVSLIVLVTTCFVRGQVNQISTEFKPPPLPPPQTPTQSTLKLPFNLPPLLPPTSNHISNLPNSNTPPPFQTPFSSPFPSHPPPQFSSQFPPQHTPQLPSQLQSQLPIQLPHQLQQQIPFQLQPPYPIQASPSFSSHGPPFLQNNLLSSLLPPQLPSTLPTKFPPPPPQHGPPKTKLHPLTRQPGPPFPALSAQTGTKNISLEANRSPRTLQMIGTNNQQTFHKISENLRPGANSWYYKKNSFPKRPPHPQAPKISITTPSPPRLIPLNQYNQLEQITKLNQQTQASLQSSFSHWPSLNNQAQSSFNTISTSFNGPPTFGNLNNLNLNSHAPSFNSFGGSVDSFPKLNSPKPPNPTQASPLNTNVKPDISSQPNGHSNHGHQAQPYHPPPFNLNQAPLFPHLHPQQSPPFNTHQQTPSFQSNPPHHQPVTPLEVFQDPALHISPINIPAPEIPYFETLRSQVSALKAKHKDFFNEHQSGDTTSFNNPQHFQPKPVYGPPPKPVYGPPPPGPHSQHLQGHASTWNPEQSKLVPPPKWNPHKFEFEQNNNFGQSLEYTTPKKTLPLQNDFVGFPPAKSSIKHELNFISNWEKGIGIIHKTDHGNAEKGQTIVAAGDTDDFKKIDKQESSKVEVFSTDKMQRRYTERGGSKKQTTAPKKTYEKPNRGRDTTEDKNQEEATTVRVESSKAGGGQFSNETQNAEVQHRKKRDVSGVESSAAESLGNATTARTIVEAKTEESQPHAEPLVAPATDLVDSTTEGLHEVEQLPQAEALVAARRAEDLLDSSEEAALLMDSEEGLYPHAAALRSYEIAEGDAYSDEEAEEAQRKHSAGLAYDDYDDDDLDDEPSIESRSDRFIFEEVDGTTLRPYAVPIISDRIDSFTPIPKSEAAVKPRGLQGRDLMAFLEEALRNSSQFLPDEAEDRSFDVVDPPTDIIKFPYYERTEPPINVDSALRFAENLTTFSKGLYESKNGNQCPEVDVEIPDDSSDESIHTFNPVQRLKRLGNKIDCLKNRNFGKDPLDNPLFKEGFVGGGRSSPDAAPSQPDASIAVFSDVIRLIKQHLDEEEKTKARDFSDIVSPRHLNLSESKTPSPNTAVLEQLRLGKRRPLLPNKQPKKVEEPKPEAIPNTTNESHGLKIVFPRRLNITKTHDEAKKASKSKLGDIEGYKLKLNHSRLTDHENYKASLARKLNFDRPEKAKIPKSQRRDSDDRFTYEDVPSGGSSFMQIFDISSFYPRFVARAHDDDNPLVTKGFETKYDQLEREADELITSVRRSTTDGDRRSANSGRNEDAKDSKDKPYGTSYSPSYRQYRLLSRKDDQKRTPTVDELVDFYSRRRSSEEQFSTTTFAPILPPISLPSTTLKVFDVSTFYPRRNEELYQSLSKRRDNKITLDDLEVLQAPKITPKSDSVEAFKPTAPTKPVIDDIADFEGSQSQLTESSLSPSSNDGHHTFKKSEPPNPDLPETDKATFHLDQPVAASGHRNNRLLPAQVIPRRQYKTKGPGFRRPPVKYRRKKVITSYYN
ncbi:uncharacterized protein LOC134288642 [Aedes albopictus]|uniref:Uncharacterized protein n=1 Tax=Aedes albopictus TaxID=7160 RepID=A0ABM1ZNZ5_AEDAL